MTDLSQLDPEAMVRFFLEAPEREVVMGERRIGIPSAEASVHFDEARGGLVTIQHGREIGQCGGSADESGL